MNYDDSLERDRELAEGGESYDKIWIIFYPLSKQFNPYEDRGTAEQDFIYEEGTGAEYGWISEKDYSNNDYAWNYKHFNPVV